MQIFYQDDFQSKIDILMSLNLEEDGTLCSHEALAKLYDIGLYVRCSEMKLKTKVSFHEKRLFISFFLFKLLFIINF